MLNSSRYILGMAVNSKFSDQLRAAVENAEETRYRISKATGISESILSRFVRGDAGLSMESTDLLCAHLGLRLVGPKVRATKKQMKGV
jgi:hypothetical protein